MHTSQQPSAGDQRRPIDSSLCPCGAGKEFSACCEPYISGAQAAPTAEALMRSRYTAFVKGRIDYLKLTLTEEQKKAFSARDTEKWARESEWLGLDIKNTEGGGPGDDRGTVEFSAQFKFSGKQQTHYEVAQFHREDGAWRYAGNIEFKGHTARRTEPKIGRNDSCPCGSGKKYKKCCCCAA